MPTPLQSSPKRLHRTGHSARVRHIRVREKSHPHPLLLNAWPNAQTRIKSLAHSSETPPHAHSLPGHTPQVNPRFRMAITAWPPPHQTCCPKRIAPSQNKEAPSPCPTIRSAKRTGPSKVGWRSPHALSRCWTLGARSQIGCQLPDASLRGTSEFRSHSRTLIGRNGSLPDTRVRPLSTFVGHGCDPPPPRTRQGKRCNPLSLTLFILRSAPKMGRLPEVTGLTSYLPGMSFTTGS